MRRPIRRRDQFQRRCRPVDRLLCGIDRDVLRLHDLRRMHNLFAELLKAVVSALDRREPVERGFGDVVNYLDVVAQGRAVTLDRRVLSRGVLDHGRRLRAAHLLDLGIRLRRRPGL